MDSLTCRERAAEDRRAAAETNLPRARAVLENSARQWDAMAAAAEHDAALTVARVAAMGGVYQRSKKPARVV